MSRRLVVLVTFSVAASACAVREGPMLGTHVQNYSTPMDAVVLLEEGELGSPGGRFDVTDLPIWRERGISIEQHTGRRTATGALEALVMVRNRKQDPLSVELRTTYFDDTRFATGSPSEWTVLNLPPNGTDRYRELSLEPTAAHYLVEVRLAHVR